MGFCLVSGWVSLLSMLKTTFFFYALMENVNIKLLCGSVGPLWQPKDNNKKQTYIQIHDNVLIFY